MPYGFVLINKIKRLPNNTYKHKNYEMRASCIIVAAVKDSFKKMLEKMLEKGLYKADLFSDL